MNSDTETLCVNATFQLKFAMQGDVSCASAPENTSAQTVLQQDFTQARSGKAMPPSSMSKVSLDLKIF
jgi:hypothetical protein